MLLAERDSIKDEAVVFIFITATAGLLLWALVKPYIQRFLVVSVSISYPIFSLPAVFFSLGSSD